MTKILDFLSRFVNGADKQNISEAQEFIKLTHIYDWLNRDKVRQ